MIVYATVTIGITDVDALKLAAIESDIDMDVILNELVREGKGRIMYVENESYDSIYEVLKLTSCAECGEILDSTDPEQCTMYEGVQRCPACLEEYIAFCNEDPDDE